MQLLSLIVTEAFSSSSFDRVYKLLINPEDGVTLKLLLDNIKNNDSNVMNKKGAHSFTKATKLIINNIFAANSVANNINISEYKSNDWELDHLIPKSKISEFGGSNSLANCSLITKANNAGKKDRFDIKYLLSDLVFKLSSKESQELQIKLYTQMMKELKQEDYHNFLNTRMEVIKGLITENNL